MVSNASCLRKPSLSGSVVAKSPRTWRGGSATPRATYALTHFFQGKEGASLDGYVRTANDILFNPEGTIERVERAYKEELEADGDDGSQASLAGERALASIERVSDDLQEKVEQFEEREDALRERFQEAMA